MESKKTKQSNLVNKSDKEHKVSESQMMTKLSTSPVTSSTSTGRPAVILLDENISDQTRSTEPEASELTFGFEVNEQLLQSEEEEEEEEETPMASPAEVSHFSNSPPNFNRQPPMFDKHVRCEKFPPNFPMSPYIPVHPLPPHPVLVQTMSYMGCPVRFSTPYMLSQHPPPLPQPQPQPLPQQQQQSPPPPPPPVVEKCRIQPKEDFSSRYIAPDESHVQKFNHDKIVSFVGLG